MAKRDETDKLSWPGHSPWALRADAAISRFTVAAALRDIL
jgi:hypothetical protein